MMMPAMARPPPGLVALLGLVEPDDAEDQAQDRAQEGQDEPGDRHAVGSLAVGPAAYWPYCGAGRTPAPGASRTAAGRTAAADRTAVAGRAAAAVLRLLAVLGLAGRAAADRTAAVPSGGIRGAHAVSSGAVIAIMMPCTAADQAGTSPGSAHRSAAGLERHLVLAQGGHGEREHAGDQRGAEPHRRRDAARPRPAHRRPARRAPSRRPTAPCRPPSPGPRTASAVRCCRRLTVSTVHTEPCTPNTTSATATTQAARRDRERQLRAALDREPDLQQHARRRTASTSRVADDRADQPADRDRRDEQAVAGRPETEPLDGVDHQHGHRRRSASRS